jgi:predicted GNAT family acetyltransferase
MLEQGFSDAVIDNPEEERLEIRQDGHVALLAYYRGEGKLFLLHTEVPPELEGRGLGGRLVHAAVEGARAAGEPVVAFCPFAQAWLRRHPDFQELLDPG